MPGPREGFRIFAGQNARIGRSARQKDDSEPIWRKTAHNFFRGQVLCVCVRLIRERWSEYRNHQGFFGLRASWPFWKTARL